VLGPQAEQQGLRLEQTPAGDGVVIAADEEALTQLLLNLVGNAIKFTPKGGSVHVRSPMRPRMSS
jgi:signal transduction histidine kinase